MAESDLERSNASLNSQNGRRLDSWKEIAAYLSRDVTTVRRWEKREGLPVHRHRHAALGSVYAFTSEIDAWQSGREPTARPDEPAPLNVIRPVLVGRGDELRRLHDHLSSVLDGTRRTVFIAGELGIGKTALTQTFLDISKSQAWFAEGQCIEQYGAGEPYLPVIEGLKRLCRDTRYPEAARAIEEHAPSWLDHIPLPSRGRPQRRPSRSPGPSPERMAGELTDAIEALSAVRPLVLLLEDLHWSDYSTVELIARLGRRRDRARLLVIGTYRPAELFESGSPLLRVCRELRAHFQADEIELTQLTLNAVSEFIARDRTWRDLQGTAECLRHWTGNPLFLVHLLQHLEASGHIVERNGEWILDLALPGRAVVSNTLRTLVEEQVDRLEPGNQRLLETASVVGQIFPAALVAYAAGKDVSLLERSFEDLCRRSHLVSRGGDSRWPDGTESTSYAFVHEFCRQVVYERLPTATLTELHRRVGERLEVAYGDRVQEVSWELATHFDRAHDFERAVRHYGIAAQNAVARSADHEAELGLSRASELVVQLPQGDQRDQLERQLRVQLGAIIQALSAAIPWIDRSAAGEIFGPGDNVEEPPELVHSLIGLSRFHSISGDLRVARQIGDRAVALVQLRNRGLFEAVTQQAYVRLLAGEFTSSRSLALEALTVADRDGVPDSHEERTRCSIVLAWSAWYLGRYDESRSALDGILPRTDESGHCATTTASAGSVAPLLESLGDIEQSFALVESPRRALERSRFVHCAWSTDAARGWLLVRRGRVSDGLAILRERERTERSVGMHAWLPQTLAWLAEGLQMDAQADDARAAAEDGLNVVRRTGVRCCDAELYRLRGEAMIAPRQSVSDNRTTKRDRDGAEAMFWAGISVARQQDARTLELRLVLSLCRLLVESGREQEARRTLEPMCDSFAHAFDTPDLTQARMLLKTIGAAG